MILGRDTQTYGPLRVKGKVVTMSKVTLNTAIALCLAVLLLLSTTTVVLASTPQLWILDNDNEMEKKEGGGDDGQDGSVTIGGNDYEIWLADQYAEVDVPFPSGSWVVELRTGEDWGTNGIDYEIAVGSWDTDGSGSWSAFSTNNQGTIDWDSGQNILVVELQTGSMTVYEDDYLALKITNNTGSSHTVYTDGRSSLRSPDTDPGYPLPEIIGAILLSTGLVAVGGYMGRKKLLARSAK